ncbi:MAG: phosphoribosylanthranilate isomerase [Campylobacteraceae bacterium]
MRVKICGITNLDDALFSINSEADALGFNFYPKSPRYIKPEIAKEIIGKLPPFVEKVGLFVDTSPEFINLTCKEVKLTLAQIHFEVDEDFLSKLEVPYLKVIRAKTKEDILKDKDEFRLVDAFVEEFGGVGKRVDLSWFKDIDTSKIILAGGLTVDILEEVKRCGFYGVDVSSGVEKTKGVKDQGKIKDYIKRAKI